MEFQFAADPRLKIEDFDTAAEALEQSWQTDPRWRGIKRPYRGKDVLRLRGRYKIAYTLAEMGANRLWRLMHEEPYVNTLGAVTGNQAVQIVEAGLQAIYVSGWQTAADNNNYNHMYPDQSLYPVDSVPRLVRSINNALLRADQVTLQQSKHDIYWLAPIVADA
jgi:isocitrate lyase